MGRDPLTSEIKDAAEALDSVLSDPRAGSEELGRAFLRTRDAMMATPQGLEAFSAVAGRYLDHETDDMGMHRDLVSSALRLSGET